MNSVFGDRPIFSKDPKLLRKQVKETGVPERFIDHLCIQYIQQCHCTEGFEKKLADAQFMQRIMKLANGGNRPSKEELLRKHHEMCEYLKGQNPDQYATNSTSNDEKSGNHICNKNLTELENIYLSDMEPDKIHYGTVLRCTALANVGHMSGAHYPLEDDNGECVSCSLYNIVPRGQKKANNFFGKGDQIYILEPYMKLQTSGMIGLRVDNIQNIKIIKKNHMKKQKPAAKQTKNTKKTNPEKWKDLGNKEFRQKHFEDAIIAYKRALATDNLELKVKILSNMAICYFKLNEPREVLECCNKCLTINPNHEKCIFRKIVALSTLREHGFTLTLLKKQKKKKSKEWKNLRKRVHRRIAESEGIYSKTSENLMNSKMIHDVDDYVGPVEIKFSAGKGRGIFATENIPGEKMIIFEKGISVRLKDNKTSTIRVNSGCELGDIGWSAEMLVQEVLLQSRKHMHINQRLSYLYNGLPESMVKIPDMNIYRTDMVQNDYQEVQFSTTAINGIIRRNAFGNNGFDSELESTSLYSLISFINSCTNPENANAICMIPTPGAAQHLKMIIALRHICAGEEIIIDYTHGKTAKERENVMKCFDIKLESEI